MLGLELTVKSFFFSFWKRFDLSKLDYEHDVINSRKELTFNLPSNMIIYCKGFQELWKIA